MTTTRSDAYGAKKFLFQYFETLAVAGARCPTGAEITMVIKNAGHQTHHKSVAISSILCREGRIEITIYGRLWRVVKILDGPHAGKETAPEPNGYRAFRRVGKTDERIEA